LTNALALSIL
jgi:putative addiction module component (TIGR02574 family)